MAHTLGPMWADRLPISSLALAVLCACGGLVERNSEDIGAAGEGGDGEPSGAGTAAQGNSGGATAGAGGAAGADPMGETVPPEVSQGYSWEECGRLSSSPNPGVPIGFTSDAKKLVQLASDGTIEVYSLPTDDFAPPVNLKPATMPARDIALSPDSAHFAEISDAIVLRALEGGAVVQEFDNPEPACIGRAIFSESGEHLAIYGGESEGCVFRISDGSLAGRLPADLPSAAFLGEAIIATGCRQDTASFCVYDVTGTAIAEHRLALDDAGVELSGEPSVSPGGDAIICRSDRAESTDASVDGLWTIWNSADGSLRVSVADSNPGSVGKAPAFSPAGDLVLFGDGVYLTRDGQRQLDAALTFDFVHGIQLSPDGRRLVTPEPSLLDVETGGSLRLLRRHDSLFSIEGLDISADGNFLVTLGGPYIGRETIGWHIAPVFEESQAIWLGRGPGDPRPTIRVSSDARFTAFSGNVRFVLDSRDGRPLWEEPTSIVESPDISCFGGEFEFSPDGSLVAGKRYATTIDVFDTGDFSLVTRLPATSCTQGIRFSPDSAWLHTPDESFDISDLPLAIGSGFPTDGVHQPFVYLELSATGSRLVTSCASDGRGCQSAVDDEPLPELDTSGEHPAYPRFSPEGHWVVKGGVLLHLPSREVRVYNEDVTEALFAPNGDIIAGDSGANIIRYCRAR